MCGIFDRGRLQFEQLALASSGDRNLRQPLTFLCAFAILLISCSDAKRQTGAGEKKETADNQRISLHEHTRPYFKSNDDYKAALDKLSESDIISHFVGGKSYRGEYPLYYITVGDTSNPAIFYISGSHGTNEKYAPHLLLDFVQRIKDQESLLESYCFIAVPLCNPYGYFGSKEGLHHNGHEYDVPGIKRATWHDMTNYSRYSGVNINRNFDYRHAEYHNLPWSVKSYWNGKNYGLANYFMMPYYLDEKGQQVYDPTNRHGNHVLMPDKRVYDWKGPAPFSEPETAFVRDVFHKFDVVFFTDWHTMNPWQTNNVLYYSRRLQARGDLKERIAEQIQAINREYSVNMPKPSVAFLEEYDGGAPLSMSWAQLTEGVTSFGWESGWNFPEEAWMEAYLRVMQAGVDWYVEHHSGE